MRAIQHSKKSVEHYGPPHLMDRVRAVMGGIDLDPASCAQANAIVQATTYYSENGLEKPWHGRVYLNPPGGETVYNGRTVNQAALWWATLALRYESGDVTEAFFTVFNLELFRYAQRYTVPHPLDYPVCFPKERLDFWKPGPDGVAVPQGSPGHPNAIVYLPPRKYGAWQFPATFIGAFQDMGKVVLPA